MNAQLRVLFLGNNCYELAVWFGDKYQNEVVFLNSQSL